MAVIGIVGGGQLAKMLAQAGKMLDHHPIVYAPEINSCAFSEAQAWQANLDDHTQAQHFAQTCDYVTCEFENIPTALLTCISAKTTFFPHARAFHIASNRVLEKNAFEKIGLATPAYAHIHNTSSDNIAKAHCVGYPLIAKAMSGGYDGKGQKRCHNPQQLVEWMHAINTECIVEEIIDFAYEFSVIVVRDAYKNTSCYPIIFNLHHQGILHLSIPLANHPIQKKAQAYACSLAEYLDYTGVLTLEMFMDKKGNILANEFAPRVHNSGHWTIEGALTSQFIHHIRAISKQTIASDLNPTTHTIPLKAPCAMINLIGQVATRPHNVGESLHIYGKSPRPGRKLGHITLMQQPNEQPTQFTQRIMHTYTTIFQKNLTLPSSIRA